VPTVNATANTQDLNAQETMKNLSRHNDLYWVGNLIAEKDDSAGRDIQSTSPFCCVDIFRRHPDIRLYDEANFSHPLTWRQ
jgi:hypothetical protein